MDKSPLPKKRKQKSYKWILMTFKTELPEGVIKELNLRKIYKRHNIYSFKTDNDNRFSNYLTVATVFTNNNINGIKFFSMLEKDY